MATKKVSLTQAANLLLKAVDTPVVETPATPVVETPATPVVETPATPATPTKPFSPLHFGDYTPVMSALVTDIVQAAEAATSAGLKVATKLAEAFVLEPWKMTNHKDALSWALALLEEACPTSANSTRYAWVEAGIARCALVSGGVDVSAFPMDTLRLIGSKSATGHNATKIVGLAKELLANKDALNSKNSVDPVKAGKIMKGQNPNAAPTREEMIVALCVLARKYCPSDAAGALDLLKSAYERQMPLVSGVVQPEPIATT